MTNKFLIEVFDNGKWDICSEGAFPTFKDAEDFAEAEVGLPWRIKAIAFKPMEKPCQPRKPKKQVGRFFKIDFAGVGSDTDADSDAEYGLDGVCGNLDEIVARIRQSLATTDLFDSESYLESGRPIFVGLTIRIDPIP